MAKRFTLKSKLNGRIHEGSFIVDDQDVAVVRQRVLRWHPAFNGALEVQVVSGRSSGEPPGGLHRTLMNAKPGEIVLFRDGDYTNMRRANMFIGNAHDVAVKGHATKKEKRRKNELRGVLEAVSTQDR